MAPLRSIHALAPVRICDIGGWTDTWFARYGKVCNIAVYPPVEVQVEVHSRGVLSYPVVLRVENFGDTYGFDPDGVRPHRHPLLEEVVADVGIPDGVDVLITVASQVPPGASTGTSATVAVALLGALDALASAQRRPLDIAYAAHRVEVERLGLQSGIQDQLAASHGGVSFIEIVEYPAATVTALRLPERLCSELERRLVLVFLGRAHQSSDVHDRVIAHLETAGADAAPLVALRAAAARARDALLAGDLDAFGQTMIDNTELQRELHADLVSAAATQVIETARAHGAIGWKVNGAGGDGGSLTLLCGDDLDERRRLVEAVSGIDASFSIIPIQIAPNGLRVWEVPGGATESEGGR